ncbi:protein-export chaperone SecB [Aquitalea sp. LB_tupeE]|uniref:protein-export chaperone SecB n=1 Tax=Aquitalea sp. LB_tupeE TaxID=2748078 RepID=UPI0015BBD1B1|nr:protein-export chaperone SecB [Aquitalea sp. LB_tupeE]NWK80324.1 protein-export chaperone SecB [Aquitalea sp. LB_tupeE]
MTISISLDSTRFENFALVDMQGENSGMNFSVESKFNPEMSNQFQIAFEISMPIEAKEFRGTFIANFVASETVNAEWVETSGFANVNSPAIAYPFLRASIATILLNAGYEPPLLPAVNFQAAFNRRRQEIQAQSSQ